MTHWLPELDKELASTVLQQQQQQNAMPHTNFRLWLTSEPHPNFSPILAEASLKVRFTHRSDDKVRMVKKCRAKLKVL